MQGFYLSTLRGLLGAVNYHIHQIYHIRPESAATCRMSRLAELCQMVFWGRDAANESLQDVPRGGRRNASGNRPKVEGLD